jgi:subtilisin family serine protease
MRKLLIAATLLLGGVTAAYAQLPDAYVGAGVSSAQIDNIADIGHDYKLNNASWKALVGIKFPPYLGVEADYLDLGSDSRSFGFGGFGDRTHVDAHAFAAFAVAYAPLPVPFLDVFGKLGAARWTLNGHDDASLFAIDDHGTDFAWGVGAQGHMGPLGLRLEYEQFDVRNTDGARVVSFDVMYHFL